MAKLMYNNIPTQFTEIVDYIMNLCNIKNYKNSLILDVNVDSIVKDVSVGKSRFNQHKILYLFASENESIFVKDKSSIGLCIGRIEWFEYSGELFTVKLTTYIELHILQNIYNKAKEFKDLTGNLVS